MQKLNALRQWMIENGFSGVLVPTADEYQGEYVAPESKRLQWITGFSGSAGEALILPKKAFLFVDGRYTLQAQKETDPCEFTVIQTPAARVQDNILTGLPENSVIGYDPWLHSPDEIQHLREICSPFKIKIMPLPCNPIDKLWTDKPKTKINPVVFLPETYTGMDSAIKLENITESLKINQDDALVLCSPESISWLLNVRGQDIPYIPVVQSFAVLYKNGTLDWFVNPAKITDRLRTRLNPNVNIKSPDLLAATLDALSIQKAQVQLDTHSSSAWIYERLSQGGARIHIKEDPCLMPKACKNKTEQNGAINAHIRDGVALCRFLCWFDANASSGELTEMDAVHKIAQLRAENDLYCGESFSTIAASGQNAAYIHYHTDEKNNACIKNNAMFLIDTGAQYLDGTTDITRTVCVGIVSDLEKKRYTQVLKGHIALASAVFCQGTTGSQLDLLARQFLWRDGVDYAHGTGHGIGSYLSVHEGPQRIARSCSKIPLMPGMLISNEPGYYKPGAFGIRLENVVMVKPVALPKDAEIKVFGLSTLGLAPFDKRLIDFTALTPVEKTWLNNYHEQVYSTISPLVDKQTACWLKTACVVL